MTEADVERLLSIEPFRQADASAFPPTLPLRGILRNDTRIVHFKDGDLIVREGDYGHSAFMILGGTVRVVLQSLDPQFLGRSTPKRPSWRRALAQLWRNSKLPEVRRDFGWSRATSRTPSASRQEIGRHPCLSARHSAPTRVAWAQFACKAARSSASWPPSRAHRGQPPCLPTAAPTLLEIRWQGLRDLMRRTPAIREHIERLYRENSFLVHLRETPLLEELSGWEPRTRVAAPRVRIVRQLRLVHRLLRTPISRCRRLASPPSR